MAGTPTNTTANTNKWSTRQLVTMALMTAIGVLLSFIEFPPVSYTHLTLPTKA